MDRTPRPAGGWGEFALVVGGAFGIFILTSFYYAAHPAAYPGHSSTTFWALTVYELVALILLGGLLHHRGWSARSLGLDFRWQDIPAGLLLAVVVWFFYAAGFALLRHAAPQLVANTVQVVRSGVSGPSALSVLLVNPFYEELFVTGYIVGALKAGRQLGLAVNGSVAVRLAYHLYQGIAGILLLVPLGLIFAIWFVRTRRLWPLIVAHAVFDAQILQSVHW